MFITRLISGIVLVILALLCNILGGDLLFVVTLLLGLIGLFELYRALSIEWEIPSIIGYLSTICYFLFLRLTGPLWTLLPLLLGLVLMLAAYVLTFPRYSSSHIMMNLFGVIYVPVMLSFIYQTRMLSGGKLLVWLIFIASWGCDTAAYCVGVKFGRRKLAPVLSPKKSIEGSIGGIAGAALIAFIYALCLLGAKGDQIARLWQYPLICAVGAIISQIGDLAASGIKRDHEIKDYGRLIPGHGGVMDRFDSVIFTAPIIYYLGLLFV